MPINQWWKRNQLLPKIFLAAFIEQLNVMQCHIKKMWPNRPIYSAYKYKYIFKVDFKKGESTDEFLS